MFKTYSRRKRIVKSGLVGFEEVVIKNHTSKYYAIDFTLARILVFNESWTWAWAYNDSITRLPRNFTYAIKYVEENFYFASRLCFYKTNLDFVLINYHDNNAEYRQIAYDSTSSEFYVTSEYLGRLDVFNTNCNLLRSIFIKETPYALALFNGNIFVGPGKSNKIMVKKIKQLSDINQLVNINVCQCSNGIRSITVDFMGYMAISCFSDNLVVLYDLNGTFTNRQILTSNDVISTSTDSKDRFFILTEHSLEIYY